MTLAEARAELREKVYTGARCPCCQQYAKVYRRTITSAMARVLIAMYHRDTVAPRQWVDLPRLREEHRIEVSGGGDAPKLAYWHLIEPMPSQRRDDGSTRAGWWRITPDGAAFARGTTRVAKHALVYGGRCLGLDDTETVSIGDALGRGFDYRALMDGT